MKGLIELKKPKLPQQWNYEESVKKVKGFIYKWKNLTTEIVIELWVAREMLSKEGRPRKTETKVSVFTWAGYCKEIGSHKVIVNRWLADFFGKIKLPPEPKQIPLSKELKVILKLGDFRKLIKDIPDNSIDLILTDPPYPKEYLPLWSDLSKEASRVLKPSGFLISYSGQAFLPKVLNMLSEHLTYYWLGMLYHKGPTAQRFEVNMWNRAKPILFFYKPPLKKQEKWLEDVLISEQADKSLHEWGQNIEPFKKLIECFTEPNVFILDPFFGGGAVIEASILTKRNIYGFEINKKSYDLVNKRIR